ncbi:MAG TPA: hypothetical protein VF593_14225 [Chthoniobacteraceae bacterium]
MRRRNFGLLQATTAVVLLACVARSSAEPEGPVKLKASRALGGLETRMMQADLIAEGNFSGVEVKEIDTRTSKAAGEFTADRILRGSKPPDKIQFTSYFFPRGRSSPGLPDAIAERLRRFKKFSRVDEDRLLASFSDGYSERDHGKVICFFLRREPSGYEPFYILRGTAHEESVALINTIEHLTDQGLPQGAFQDELVELAKLGGEAASVSVRLTLRAELSNVVKWDLLDRILNAAPGKDTASVAFDSLVDALSEKIFQPDAGGKKSEESPGALRVLKKIQSPRGATQEMLLQLLPNSGVDVPAVRKALAGPR